MQAPGLSRLDTGEFGADSPPKSGAETAAAEAPKEATLDAQLSEEEKGSFASRRLSLNNPFEDDAEWAEIVETAKDEADEGEEEYV